MGRSVIGGIEEYEVFVSVQDKPSSFRYFSVKRSAALSAEEGRLWGSATATKELGEQSKASESGDSDAFDKDEPCPWASNGFVSVDSADEPQGDGPGSRRGAMHEGDILLDPEGDVSPVLAPEKEAVPSGLLSPSHTQHQPIPSFPTQTVQRSLHGEQYYAMLIADFEPVRGTRGTINAMVSAARQTVTLLSDLVTREKEEYSCPSFCKAHGKAEDLVGDTFHGDDTYRGSDIHHCSDISKESGISRESRPSSTQSRFSPFQSRFSSCHHCMTRREAVSEYRRLIRIHEKLELGQLNLLETLAYTRGTNQNAAASVTSYPYLENSDSMAADLHFQTPPAWRGYMHLFYLHVVYGVDPEENQSLVDEEKDLVHEEDSRRQLKDPFVSMTAFYQRCVDLHGFLVRDMPTSDGHGIEGAGVSEMTRGLEFKQEKECSDGEALSEKSEKESGLSGEKESRLSGTDLCFLNREHAILVLNELMLLDIRFVSQTTFQRALSIISHLLDSVVVESVSVSLSRFLYVTTLRLVVSAHVLASGMPRAFKNGPEGKPSESFTGSSGRKGETAPTYAQVLDSRPEFLWTPSIVRHGTVEARLARVVLDHFFDLVKRGSPDSGRPAPGEYSLLRSNPVSDESKMRQDLDHVDLDHVDLNHVDLDRDDFFDYFDLATVKAQLSNRLAQLKGEYWWSEDLRFVAYVKGTGWPDEEMNEGDRVCAGSKGPSAPSNLQTAPNDMTLEPKSTREKKRIFCRLFGSCSRKSAGSIPEGSVSKTGLTGSTGHADGIPSPAPLAETRPVSEHQTRETQAQTRETQAQTRETQARVPLVPYYLVHQLVEELGIEGRKNKKLPHQNPQLMPELLWLLSRSSFDTAFERHLKENRLLAVMHVIRMRAHSEGKSWLTTSVEAELEKVLVLKTTAQMRDGHTFYGLLCSAMYAFLPEVDLWRLDVKLNTEHNGFKDDNERSQKHDLEKSATTRK